MNSGYRALENMSQAVWYNKWTVKKFEKYLHGNILEVGCGIGTFTKDLKKYGRVWAIDKNQDYVVKIARISGVNGGAGDIEKGRYFFKNKRFDCIVCINVLEHIENDLEALTNMYNLLNKEGHLVMVVPAFDFLFGEIDKSVGHFRRYNKKNLNMILEKTGLKVKVCKILNFPGGVGWFIEGRILKRGVIEEERIKIFSLIAPFLLKLEDVIEPPLGTSILIIAQK